MIDQIICGDCLEVMPTLEDKSVDLIIADPPYFLPAQSYVGVRGVGYHNRTLADTTIPRTFFKVLFNELNRIIKDTGAFYVFCDAQSYPLIYMELFPFCKYVRLLIWDKMVSYNGYTWRHQHELIAWGELNNTYRVPTGDGDVLKCRGVLQKDRTHPAEKPVKLIEKLVTKSSNENDVILDPFAGTGAVLIAAKAQNRRYIGVEFDEQYIKIAEKRIAEML